MMKKKLCSKFLMSAMLIGTSIFMSCSDESTSSSSCEVSGKVIAKLMEETGGQVDGFDTYGMLVPSFTPSDLMNAGFEYSDLLNVKIGDKIELKDVPFVTGFNEVGVLETCFCDYNRLGTVYGFGQLHGNFKERIGGTVGDDITVTLSKKHGYKDTWDVMKSVYTYARTDYPLESDEEFANFREITTSGMKKGVLYRSSNPLNPKDNAVRFAYVDKLAEKYGIKTEIDLADTDAKIMDYRKRDDYTSTYCPALYDNKKVIALGLTADTYGTTFMQTLGRGLKFMIDNEPPYLLHCNEGKDRCGFVSMLLEAFAGATYDELAADYTKTLMNFYKIEKGSDSYNLRRQLSIDRLIWLLENVDTLDDFGNVDWSDKDPRKVDLRLAAQKYILKCGLTEDECDKLWTILTGKE